MKVLIATPANQGMVTTHYLLSYTSTLVEASRSLQQGGPQIETGLYTLSNEALVPRGRNHCAQVALKQGWDKIIFIDADVGWSWDQFARVISSPYPITAGVCPLKMYPIILNFLPFEEDEECFAGPDGQVAPNFRHMPGLIKMRDKHFAKTGSPLAKVPFVGTAFMCIDRKVLLDMSEVAAPYRYPNPNTGQDEMHWDFFNTKPVANKYMSEDWGFCHEARKRGFDVAIDTEVVVNHTGTHTFVAGALPPRKAPGGDKLVPAPKSTVLEIVGDSNQSVENTPQPSETKAP